MPIPPGAKQKVEEILGKSSLSLDDKSLWRERLEAISEIYTDMFLELFSEDSKELPEETKRLKQKIATKDDPEELARTAEEEKTALLADFDAAVGKIVEDEK